MRSTAQTKTKLYAASHWRSFSQIHFHIYSIANMDNIIKEEFEHDYEYRLHIKLVFSIFSKL